MTNPLMSLRAAGQSVWLDYMHKDILASGALARMIAEDGLGGLTSNPSIFEAAIAKSGAYDTDLKALVDQADGEVMDLYERLAIADIRAAADAFAPLYDQTAARDGYVSLEVSPYLAMDTAGTLAEARRLWAAVDRPNLMIKVPGTAAGVPAIQALIGEGINVNVTLLFSLAAYQAVAQAHIAGLEHWQSRGGDPARVHGVASFFVSRIDGVMDGLIDNRIAAGEPAPPLAALRGKVAIANAKMAYQDFLERSRTPRWRVLAEAGAAPQRLLWASTGTKDPAYSDVLYIDSLIGPYTVNTVPPATLDAFRDHGVVAASLAGEVAAARRVLAQAADLGLDLDRVTDDLLAAGVKSFSEAFDRLLAAVADKRSVILGDRLNGQSL